MLPHGRSGQIAFPHHPSGAKLAGVSFYSSSGETLIVLADLRGIWPVHPCIGMRFQARIHDLAICPRSHGTNNSARAD